MMPRRASVPSSKTSAVYLSLLVAAILVRQRLAFFIYVLIMLSILTFAVLLNVSGFWIA